MSELGKKIREAREARGLSQADLSAATKTAQQTIARVEIGVTKWSRSLVPVCKFLGIDVEEPCPKDAQSPTDAIVTIYATDGGEISGRAIGNAGRPLSLAGVPDAYAIYMNGSGMNPIFRSGDLLIANPHQPPRAGDRVILRNGGRYLVRILVSENDSAWVVSSPAGEDEIPKKDYGVAHKIVACTLI